MEIIIIVLNMEGDKISNIHYVDTFLDIDAI